MQRMLSLSLSLVLSAVLAGGCARAPEAVPRPAGPAAVTSTDIYLYRLTGIPGLTRGRVSNLTNRAGYDNQPSWLTQRKLLYTSESGGQTDIYSIDIESGETARITSTPESEYSAAPTPDGKGITVVRVELDSVQRLWHFPVDRGPARVVLPDVKPVGYFAWLDTTTVALFVLGNPNTLRLADTRTGVATVVTSDIGRSLQRVPGGRRGSFVQRAGNRWVLKAVDPGRAAGRAPRVDSLGVLPDSAEFVVWRSPTELYTAGGSRLYRMRLPNRAWVELDDLSGAGVRRITRLALSPDGSRLLLVAEDGVDRP